jgi:hypothetical protein
MYRKRDFLKLSPLRVSACGYLVLEAIPSSLSSKLASRWKTLFEILLPGSLLGYAGEARLVGQSRLARYTRRHSRPS